uniref:CYP718B1 n=1 Tax=Taxus chinensis TaxID=29808 RepID=A0A291FB27_TAXCH|nr:CYP718B1 [Taxus chinensis]
MDTVAEWTSSSWILIAAMIIGFLLFYQHITHTNNGRLNLPPGNLGLPVIGETLQFYRSQKSNRLFEDFFGKRTHKYGSVYKTGLMGSPTVIFTGAAGNRFLLSNEFKLVTSSWPQSTINLIGTGSIMEKQGAEHKRLRGAVMACFRADVLQSFVGKLSNVIEYHFERHWKGNRVVRVYPLTKLLTFTSVCSLFLGLEDEGEIEYFLKLFQMVLLGVLSLPVDFPGSRCRRAKRARREIDEFLSALIDRRRRDLAEGRAGGEQDLFSRLLTLNDEDGNRLGDKEVMDNIVLFMFAAHDTTSLVITMMCKFLCQHKDCYHEICQEHKQILESKEPGEKLNWEDAKNMTYTWRAAQETMRLLPPIFGSFKKAIVDFEYEGYTIPKGWKVLWTASTHYDPNFFEEPQKFKPSRFQDTIPPYVFVPFGGGVRLCAGLEFAKLQITVFMHHLVTQYDWSLVDPAEGIQMDPLPSPTKGMPVRLVKKSY